MGSVAGTSIRQSCNDQTIIVRGGGYLARECAVFTPPVIGAMVRGHYYMQRKPGVIALPAAADGAPDDAPDESLRGWQGDCITHGMKPRRKLITVYTGHKGTAHRRIAKGTREARAGNLFVLYADGPHKGYVLEHPISDLKYRGRYVGFLSEAEFLSEDL